MRRLSPKISNRRIDQRPMGGSLAPPNQKPDVHAEVRQDPEAAS